MIQKVLLVPECDLKYVIDDLQSRLCLNYMRFCDNNKKMNGDLIENLSFVRGVYETLQKLDLVDEVTEKDFKDYYDLFN